MSDITAEGLAKMQASLDRIEDMLTGLTEPAHRSPARLRIARPERPEPPCEIPLPEHLAEVVDISAARK